MGFPLALIPAAVGAVGSLFSPKQNNRLPQIADQIGSGDKFNELYQMLLEQSRNGGGALTEEQIRAIGVNMGEQASPLLDSLLSRVNSSQASRGVADSRLGAFNSAQAGRDFSLQQSGALTDLMKQNALQGFQGRQNALRGMQGLVGQGLQVSGQADNNEARQGANFGNALSGLTGGLTQYFQNKSMTDAMNRNQRRNQRPVD